MDKGQIPLYRRILAYCIDFPIIMIIYGIFLIPVSILSVYITILNDSVVSLQIMLMTTSFLYFYFMEYYFSSTIGKKLFNYETISEYGEKLSFSQYFVLALGKIHPVVIILDFIIGFTMSFSINEKLTQIQAKTTFRESHWKQNYNNEEQSVFRVFKIVLAILGIFLLLIMILSLPYTFGILK